MNSSLFMKYSVVADVASVHWPNIIFNSLFKTFKDDCTNVHRAHLSSNNFGNTVESNKYSSSSTDVLTWLRVLSLFSWMVLKSVEIEVVCVREQYILALVQFLLDHNLKQHFSVKIIYTNIK